ncbi:helix-turn-helix domain-containing protein [Streptomyces sp. NPDC014623]|uniref:helix-turn-helix domain-containing protein n=1 Tax=Streptomyces sp. NPDC014623 TaxID=3364875 RepID=UPI0036F6D22A
MSDLVGDARTWSPDAQEAVRLLAVSAPVEGRDRAEAAVLFKVSVRAVDTWWTRWQTGGRDALLSRPRGRRADEHQVLSEAEQAAIRPSGTGITLTDGDCHALSRCQILRVTLPRLCPCAIQP